MDQIVLSVQLERTADSDSDVSMPGKYCHSYTTFFGGMVALFLLLKLER
jgi:hypothetical protein